MVVVGIYERLLCPLDATRPQQPAFLRYMIGDLNLLFRMKRRWIACGIMCRLYVVVGISFWNHVQGVGISVLCRLAHFCEDMMLCNGEQSRTDLPTFKHAPASEARIQCSCMQQPSAASLSGQPSWWRCLLSKYCLAPDLNGWRPIFVPC